MKSDKKRPDRAKSNKNRFNRDKFNEERAEAENLDAEKPDKEAGKEKQGSAEDENGGNDGEKRASEESGSVKADSTEEADGTEKADSTEEADSTVKADSTEEADSAAKAGRTEEAGGTEKADSTEEADSTVEKDSAMQAQSGRPDDQENEGEDWEDDDLQDDWEEDSEPSKPWVVALVFLGLVFAAACICVTLWIFTHPDRQEGNQNIFAGTTAAPGSSDTGSPSQMTPSGTGNLPLENQGGNAASEVNSGETDASAQASNLNRITTQDGRVIIFKDCDDVVTPKEYVNLRTEPSTSQGDATVGCSLTKGETAHRTGISEEMGWSRVEYNDQVLYVVTSLVNVVTDSQTTE